jgi:hypothetical protein
MKPIKKWNIEFDFVSEFIKFFLYFNPIASLISLKEPFSMRRPFLIIEFFLEGFLIYNELI